MRCTRDGWSAVTEYARDTAGPAATVYLNDPSSAPIRSWYPSPARTMGTVVTCPAAASSVTDGTMRVSVPRRPSTLAEIVTGRPAATRMSPERTWMLIDEGNRRRDAICEARSKSGPASTNASTSANAAPGVHQAAARISRGSTHWARATAARRAAADWITSGAKRSAPDLAAGWQRQLGL